MSAPAGCPSGYGHFQQGGPGGPLICSARERAGEKLIEIGSGVKFQYRDFRLWPVRFELPFSVFYSSTSKHVSCFFPWKAIVQPPKRVSYNQGSEVADSTKLAIWWLIFVWQMDLESGASASVWGSSTWNPRFFSAWKSTPSLEYWPAQERLYLW